MTRHPVCSRFPQSHCSRYGSDDDGLVSRGRGSRCLDLLVPVWRPVRADVSLLHVSLLVRLQPLQKLTMASLCYQAVEQRSSEY